MKKIKSFISNRMLSMQMNLFAILSIFSVNMNAQIATIGIGGATSSAGSNAGPIFRSSAASTFDYSNHYFLYTAAELSASGITLGATITALAWNKGNAFGTVASNTSSILKVHMKNTSVVPDPNWCSSSYATQSTGATLVYNNTAQVIPLSSGYITLTLSTPFVYSGGSLEIGTNWDCSAYIGNPTTGGFSWKQDALSNQVFGGSHSSSNSVTMALQSFRPQIQFSYTMPAPCSGMPIPGNTLSSAAPIQYGSGANFSHLCVGSSTTLSLENNSGAGATYQWYLNSNPIPGATNETYTTLITDSSWLFRCAVTCSGLTAYSYYLLIMVEPIPEFHISASAASISCGQTLNLTANHDDIYSMPHTYTWLPGNMTGSTISVSPLTTTAYTVVASYPYGCTSTATFTVPVSVNANITISGSTSSLNCGQNRTLTANGGISYTWQPGALTGSSVTLTPLTTTTYTVTGTTANGCTNTATRTVVVNPINVNIAGSSFSLTCGQTGTLSATGASTYLWQPVGLVGSSVIVTPLSTTTYTVIGTSADGCTNSDTITVSVPPMNVIASGSANINCGQGGILSASGGISYLWQPGSIAGSPLTVFPTTTTTYTVTATNSFGCTKTATHTIMVGPSTVSIAPATITLNCGQSTSLNASGPAGTYIWQPGSLNGSSILVTPLTTTIYTVTVTTPAGCTGTATRTVVVNHINVNIAGASFSLTCGQSGTLSATGASTYLWQPGGLIGSSVIVTPLSTTTYTVIGTSANGCTNSDTITVSVPPMNVTANGTAGITCGQGGSLSATGGSSYLWQPGSINGSPLTVFPTTTTTYTVTATNSFGCTRTATHTIIVVPITVSISGSSAAIICGANKSLTANGATIYLWQPGSLTGSNVVVSPSVTTTYTVTGTNSMGCTNTATRTVTVNPNGTTSSATACNFYTWNTNGMTYTASGMYTSTSQNVQGCMIIEGLNLTILQETSNSTSATACDSYTWNGATYTASGTYTSTSLNAAGCTHTDMLNLTIHQSTSSSSTVTASGSYTWNGNTYTASGVYTNTSLTAEGCIHLETLHLTIPLTNCNFTMALIEDQPIQCFGSNNGALQVNTSPSASYTYTILSPDAATSTNTTGYFANLIPGSHTVTATSTLGTCHSTILFEEPSPLAMVFSTDSLVSCQGDDGALSVNITGGTNVLQDYLTWWTNSNGDTLNDILTNNFAVSMSNLSAGNYNVSIEDDHGCFFNQSVVLLAAAPIVVSAAATPILCHGGGAVITPYGTGGLSPLSYTINGAPISSNYQAGTYTIIATDSKGCTGLTTIAISQPDLLQSMIYTPIVYEGSYFIRCHGNTDGLINVEPLGGTAPYSYVWSTGSTLQNQTGLSAGSYSVTITDNEGCTNFTSLTLHEPPALSTTITQTNPMSCIGSNNAIISLTVSGGDGSSSYSRHRYWHPYAQECYDGGTSCWDDIIIRANNYIYYYFQWSNGSTSQNLTGVSSGTYTVTVSDGNGCTATNSITLSDPVIATTSFSATACDSYIWNGSTYTVSGAYTNTYTSANGCDSIQTLNLTINSNTTMVTASGSYTWAVNGYTYSTSGTYTYTSANSTSCGNTFTLNLVIGVTLNLTCLIQGYWDGVASMLPVLANQGISASIGDCDSITVELHEAVVPYNVVYSAQTILHQDGTATCSFPSWNSPYYIVVKHRNAIATWSATPVQQPLCPPVCGGPVVHNFTLAATQAYGSNQVEVAPNVFAFYSGDINQDENTDLLDLADVENDIDNFSFGYFATDINGDGNVDLLDIPLVENNINNFIFSAHP